MQLKSSISGKKEPKHKLEKRQPLLTNTARKTGYPYAEDWNESPVSFSVQKLTQNGTKT